VALPAAFAIGLDSGFSGTGSLSSAQLIVLTEMQGRYFGIDLLGSRVIVLVGIILGGLFVASLGVGNTYLVAGVGWMIVGLHFLIPRGL
jgi:hypothetical protein